MADQGAVTVPELHARYPHIPAHTIRRACRSGEFAGARVAAGVWLIPPDEATVWAESYARYGALRRSRGGRQRDADL